MLVVTKLEDGGLSLSDEAIKHFRSRLCASFALADLLTMIVDFYDPAKSMSVVLQNACLRLVARKLGQRLVERLGSHAMVNIAARPKRDHLTGRFAFLFRAHKVLTSQMRNADLGFNTQPGVCPRYLWRSGSWALLETWA